MTTPHQPRSAGPRRSAGKRPIIRPARARRSVTAAVTRHGHESRPGLINQAATWRTGADVDSHATGVIAPPVGSLLAPVGGMRDLWRLLLEKCIEPGVRLIIGKGQRSHQAFGQ